MSDAPLSPNQAKEMLDALQKCAATANRLNVKIKFDVRYPPHGKQPKTGEPHVKKMVMR